MFCVRGTSEKQIVVYRQIMHADLNRYAHDYAAGKNCAKDSLPAGDRHLCKWASRAAAVPHNQGPAPDAAQSISLPVCEGNGANPGIDPGVRAS